MPAQPSAARPVLRPPRHRVDPRARRWWTVQALLPPAPRTVALRVATDVLGAPFAPDATGPAGRLERHPRAALRRRLVRGALCAVLPGTAVLAAGAPVLTPVLWHAAWSYALLSGLAVAWLARDAYRNLGHGLHGRHLVLSRGTFSRETVKLARAGIVGWTFTDSPFGRRAGLVTLTAAVAAGENGYRSPDLAAVEAPAFAAAATPGLLDEFLVTGGRATGRAAAAGRGD